MGTDADGPQPGTRSVEQIDAALTRLQDRVTRHELAAIDRSIDVDADATRRLIVACVLVWLAVYLARERNTR